MLLHFSVLFRFQRYLIIISAAFSVFNTIVLRKPPPAENGGKQTLRALLPRRTYGRILRKNIGLIHENSQKNIPSGTVRVFLLRSRRDIVPFSLADQIF